MVGPPGKAGAARAPMSRKQMVIAVTGCFATLLLGLLDQNIVSAVSWTMVKDLDPVHGVGHLPWLLTAYTLADCIVLPLYGKLADVYGAKRIYLLSLGIFLTGSALCGIAQNMVELIAFRALQGIGGGGLMSVTMVVLGLLVRPGQAETPEDSGKAGMGGIMVGLGIVLGPAAGGLVASHLSWRWVFYINIPLGIGAFVTSLLLVRLPVTPIRRRIDFLGAGLIAAAASALLMISQWGGKDYAWTSPTIEGLGITAVVLLAAFLWRQTTAAEPIFTLALLRNPIFRIMVPLGFFGGIGLAGSVAYMSGYLQEARGMTPTSAGLLLFPMAVGMIIVGALSGKAMVKMAGRYRYQLLAGHLLVAAAMLIFSTLGTHTSLWFLSFGLFLLGLGLGLNLGIGLMITQSAVDADDLGVATTSVRFAQQLGASAGLAMFGTILNRELAAKLNSAAGAANANGQLNTAALPTLAPDQRHAALQAITSSTHMVFAIAAYVMIIPAVLSMFLKEQPISAATTTETPNR
ncbi:MFS transporter [Actinoallomurus purpureus]|uniref:MFS transporter n=1 Tax=Actinoallomurus purpureus TaxID=478114 RepID=UPI002093AA7B|nr:MFS transporter [Actinoallomurus purpureus]MCO6006870.1 MFS transporter [Actinoallomurus purpureus]